MLVRVWQGAAWLTLVSAGQGWLGTAEPGLSNRVRVRLGSSRCGRARQGWLCWSRHDLADLGAAGQGLVRQGWHWHMLIVSGLSGHGTSRRGWHGLARHGAYGRVYARRLRGWAAHGLAWLAGRGVADLGVSRLDSAGRAIGMAWLAWQALAQRIKVRLVRLWQGVAWLAWLGSAQLGTVLCGAVQQGRSGAGQGWLC